MYIKNGLNNSTNNINILQNMYIKKNDSNSGKINITNLAININLTKYMNSRQ